MTRVASQNPLLCYAPYRSLSAAHVAAQRRIRTHLVFPRRIRTRARSAIRRAVEIVMMIVVMVVMGSRWLRAALKLGSLLTRQMHSWPRHGLRTGASDGTAVLRNRNERRHTCRRICCPFDCGIRTPRRRSSSDRQPDLSTISFTAFSASISVVSRWAASSAAGTGFRNRRFSTPRCRLQSTVQLLDLRTLHGRVHRRTERSQSLLVFVHG